MTYEMLMEKIRSLPEECLEEVGEFIEYLRLRAKFSDFEKWKHQKRFPESMEKKRKPIYGMP